MSVLAALQTVLSGPHDSRGLLRWAPALWSALASVLVAVVSEAMGFHILAAFFFWTAAPFLFLAIVSVAVATAARLKRAPDA